MAEKPGRGAQPAKIHTCVNSLSFSAATLRLAYRACVGRFWPRTDMRKELIMINQEGGFPPADWDWMGPPIDLRQTASEVIATTRREWALRGAVAEHVLDRARFAHPLFGIALDAKSSGAVRARALRARSRRRASLQFAA
jgi:hypothetical protein